MPVSPMAVELARSYEQIRSQEESSYANISNDNCDKLLHDKILREITSGRIEVHDEGFLKVFPQDVDMFWKYEIHRGFGYDEGFMRVFPQDVDVFWKYEIHRGFGYDEGFVKDFKQYLGDERNCPELSHSFVMFCEDIVWDYDEQICESAATYFGMPFEANPI